MDTLYLNGNLISYLKCIAPYPIPQTRSEKFSLHICSHRKSSAQNRLSASLHTVSKPRFKCRSDSSVTTQAH